MRTRGADNMCCEGVRANICVCIGLLHFALEVQHNVWQVSPLGGHTATLCSDSDMLVWMTGPLVDDRPPLNGFKTLTSARST